MLKGGASGKELPPEMKDALVYIQNKKYFKKHWNEGKNWELGAVDKTRYWLTADQKRLNDLKKQQKKKIVHGKVTMGNTTKKERFNKEQKVLKKKRNSLLPSVIHDIETNNTEVIPGLYINWEQSCYLDSLLFAMFIGNSPYFRKLLLLSEIKPEEYKKRYAICKKASKLKTTEDIVKYAHDLQGAFRVDYNILFNKKQNLECSNVRGILLRCLVNLKTNKGWIQETPSVIYGNLIETFPSNINVKLKTGSTMNMSHLFDMGSFMTPTPGDPVWNELDSSVHVISFRNRAHDPQNFRNASKENIFSEYIINNKYRLFAVIYHLGKRRGAGHYVSYIRISHVPSTWQAVENESYDLQDNKQSNWYYYNDLSIKGGPVLQKCPGLPDKVFIDSENGRPMLYFYERISK